MIELKGISTLYDFIKIYGFKWIINENFNIFKYILISFHNLKETITYHFIVGLKLQNPLFLSVFITKQLIILWTILSEIDNFYC
jgi:hypothetical protein